jgi:hypothetical protein
MTECRGKATIENQHSHIYEKLGKQMSNVKRSTQLEQEEQG